MLLGITYVLFLADFFCLWKAVICWGSCFSCVQEGKRTYRNVRSLFQIIFSQVGYQVLSFLLFWFACLPYFPFRRKLMNIAFSDMNPFPMKLLQNRRGEYRLKLEAEMKDLEQIKAQYMKKKAEHAASQLDGAGSEDEEDM